MGEQKDLFTGSRVKFERGMDGDIVATPDADGRWVVSAPDVSRYYLGVDLGVNGACVVLDHIGEVHEVFNTPDTRSGFIERFKKYEQCKCFCITEKVASMPQNGVKASHTFGVIVERTLYTLELCKIPFQEVTPQTWMKTYMLKKDKGESHTSWKNRLKTKAQQLFPHQKITLATADAFLIAEYARRNY